MIFWALYPLWPITTRLMNALPGELEVQGLVHVRAILENMGGICYSKLNCYIKSTRGISFG